MINMSFQKADTKAISMCSPALTDNPFPMVGCEIIQVNEAYQLIFLALTWDQMFGFGEQSLVSIFDLIQNVPQNGKVEGCGQISPFITRFLRIKSPSFLQMAVMIMNLIQSGFLTKYKVWKIIITRAQKQKHSQFVMVTTNKEEHTVRYSIWHCCKPQTRSYSLIICHGKRAQNPQNLPSEKVQKIWKTCFIFVKLRFHSMLLLVGFCV